MPVHALAACQAGRQGAGRRASRQPPSWTAHWAPRQAGRQARAGRRVQASAGRHP